MEFGLLSPIGSELHRQIYNVDKSLYTNNLQSFNTLFCQKVNARGQRESTVQCGSAHFSFSSKINVIRSDIWGRYLTFHSGFG